MGFAHSFKGLATKHNIQGRGSDDFIRLIELIEAERGRNESDSEKSRFFKEFINEEGLPLNIHDIIKILDRTRVEGNNDKSLMIQDYMFSKRSLELTKDDFTRMIIDSNIGDEREIMPLIEVFINSDKSSGITIDNFIPMIQEVGITENDIKVILTNIFIKSDKSSGINIKDVAEMINGAKIIGDDIKVSAIQYFFNSNKSSGITDENVTQMINDAEISHDTKSLIIKTFNINNLIKGIEQRSDSDKSSNIKDFIKNSDKSLGINLGDVFKIINDTKITDYRFKYSIMCLETKIIYKRNTL